MLMLVTVVISFFHSLYNDYWFHKVHYCYQQTTSVGKQKNNITTIIIQQSLRIEYLQNV